MGRDVPTREPSEAPRVLFSFLAYLTWFATLVFVPPAGAIVTPLFVACVYVVHGPMRRDYKARLRAWREANPGASRPHWPAPTTPRPSGPPPTQGPKP